MSASARLCPGSCSGPGPRDPPVLLAMCRCAALRSLSQASEARSNISCSLCLSWPQASRTSCCLNLSLRGLAAIASLSCSSHLNPCLRVLKTLIVGLLSCVLVLLVLRPPLWSTTYFSRGTCVHLSGSVSVDILRVVRVHIRQFIAPSFPSVFGEVQASMYLSLSTVQQQRSASVLVKQCHRTQPSSASSVQQEQ